MNIPKVALLLVFLVSLFVRTYKLTSVPNGFYNEEVTNAYVGRYILQNGVDLYGNPWPLIYFDKFRDYPPVLPMYLSGAATYIFGMTEFAARIPIAFLGALTVLPVYALTLTLSGSVVAGLAAGLFVGIFPWHVVLSRTTAEGVVGFIVFIWGLQLLTRGLRHNSVRSVLYSVPVFVLTYFLYPSLRILVPLIWLPVPFLFIRRNPVMTRAVILIMVFFIALTSFIASTYWGKGRFEQTSLFRSIPIREQIQSNSEALSNDEGQNRVLLARIFHNKAVLYTREFISQYFSYFSPRYLFMAAGGQYRYYNVPDQGLLYIVTVPLLVLGLYFMGRISDKFQFFILYLLAITPLPSALTVDFVPHVHRSMFMILPLAYLAAVGFAGIWHSGRTGKLLAFVFAVALSVEVIYFWHMYDRHNASLQSVLRNDGEKQMVWYVNENFHLYEDIIIPMKERIPMYFLYFSRNLDKSLAGKFRTEIQIDRIGKVRFVDDWCPSKQVSHADLSADTLIVENGDCPQPEGYTQVHMMLRADSTQAYRFLVPTEAKSI